MKYQWYLYKRRVEDMLMWPLILLGKWLAAMKPLPQEYEVFYFFPFYHTGGAEKVHALVTQATGNSNCIIFFTRKSVDQNFYQDFVNSQCTIRDISAYTGSKWLYPVNIVYRGMMSAWINRQQRRPIVFNGQCNFGYKISPWIDRRIPQIELIHSYNTFSWIRLPFLPFIRHTVMISKVRIDNHLQQYKRLRVPPHFAQRIQYIVNGIPLPKALPTKDFDGAVRVLYVGRGTPEKRVHIIAKMAQQARRDQLNTEFIFMGDVGDAIPPPQQQYCKLLGHVSDAAQMHEAYCKAHVVIITSNTEGFPLAIEEGMARGCAVMATPVGDIPVHVKNLENGLLFSSVDDEATIIEEGIEFLQLLCRNKKPLQETSQRNIAYANAHFSIDAFNDSYRRLFHQLSQP